MRQVPLLASGSSYTAVKGMPEKPYREPPQEGPLNTATVPYSPSHPISMAVRLLACSGVQRPGDRMKRLTTRSVQPLPRYVSSSTPLRLPRLLGAVRNWATGALEFATGLALTAALAEAEEEAAGEAVGLAVTLGTAAPLGALHPSRLHTVTFTIARHSEELSAVMLHVMLEDTSEIDTVRKDSTLNTCVAKCTRTRRPVEMSSLLHTVLLTVLVNSSNDTSALSKPGKQRNIPLKHTLTLGLGTD